MGGNNDEKLKGPELHHFDEAVISAKIAFGKYFTPDDWARFEKKFREMDQNGSGHLSLEDLKRFVILFFFFLSPSLLFSKRFFLTFPSKKTKKQKINKQKS